MHWIIHIGVPKTGSKAIQRFLADHVHRIRNRQVCFPQSGRSDIWHLPLYEELVKGGSGLVRAAIDEASRRADTAVLSFEGFFRLKEPGIATLHAALGAGTVVCFIRRQDQLVNSTYNQLFKAHRRSYSHIVEFESSMLDYHRRFDHLRTLSRWASVFGSANTLPIVYDKRGDSIAQFCERVGLAVDLTGYDVPNPNPALDAESLSVMRFLKQNHGDLNGLPELVTAAHAVLKEQFVDLYSTGQEQYLLSLAQRSAIYRHYVDSNERLRALYFPAKDTLFPPLEDAPVCQTDLPVDPAIVRKIRRLKK